MPPASEPASAWLSVPTTSLGEASDSPVSLAGDEVGRGDSSTSPPEYLARNSATTAASSPTTMFWGMIAPENPPLRIAKSASL